MLGMSALVIGFTLPQRLIGLRLRETYSRRAGTNIRGPPGTWQCTLEAGQSRKATID